MMEFDGSFDSHHSADYLWNYFTDPDVLAQCAPGTEKIDMLSPSQLEAVISVGVGSIKPTFDVDMTVTKADRPKLLEMEVGGDAARNSFEAVATMQLTENGDGTTTCDWSAKTNVSGLLASLGGRALKSVTNKLVTDFFEDLEALADEGVPAEAKLRAKDGVEAKLDG